MSNQTQHNPERLDELMVDAATQGLNPQDQAELSAALAQDAALRTEAEAYELAATAIELAMTKPSSTESLPASLREKLLADAQAQRPSQSASTNPGLKLAGSQASQVADTGGFKWTDGRAFGWYAAIAATLALCVMLMQPNNQGPQTITPPDELTLQQKYEALAANDETVTAKWGFAGGDANEQFANATGEVIWNNESQTGYMKLNGMPINNPTEVQYQLWIVDASRDTSVENTNRVDGGVFDITAKGEVIVPINAKLLARDAAVFAITAESPGGVVESKGPLQVVAVVEKEQS